MTDWLIIDYWLLIIDGGFFAKWPESTQIEDASCGESEWEAHPDACGTPAADDAEEIGQRKGDDDVGKERILHEFLDIA